MIKNKYVWFVLLILVVVFGSYLLITPKPGEKHEAHIGHLWTCSMHPQVIQEKPGRCPICHMQLTPLKVDDEVEKNGEKSSKVESNNSVKRKIKYWWDPMLSPPFISDKPGKSPMGMDLIPVYEDEAHTGGSALSIDPTVVQNMGIRTVSISSGTIRRSVRAFGSLAEAQPNIYDVNLRVTGWVRRLYANTEGMHIKAGEPLFDLYSPELEVAVQELISARRSISGKAESGSSLSESPGRFLYDTGVRKLIEYGLTADEVQRLSKLEHVPATITFRSPISGHVTQKLIVEGAGVKAGDKILQLVDHTNLWADVQVFEKQLALIKLSQEAELRFESTPGKVTRAEVIFIHPHLDMTTRTGLVRLSVSNEALDLRPGMYLTATILIPGTSASTIIAPREAIIDTGEKQLVFVALGEGHFEPRNVVMGLEDDKGMVEILYGLKAGDEVVTSGHFLLDSESRLKEAVQKFLSQKQRKADSEESRQ